MSAAPTGAGTGARGSREGRRRPLPALLALAACALILGATAEERVFSGTTDQQLMLQTAVAIAEFGEVGIPRGGAWVLPRPGGDGVAVYGLGLPAAESLPALLAGTVEARLGPASSQTLFVALQCAFVLGAAAAAGRLALALGASGSGAALAIAATALGSPLWAYPSAGYSEPLQALLLAGALAAALEGRAGRAAPAAAGLLAGLAVLVKSANLALVPFLLLPLVPEGPRGPGGASSRPRRLLAAAAGLSAPIAAWLVLEVVRFGRPFASYGGEGFRHPLADGAWRLLVSPGKGLLLYFPVALLAFALLPRLLRARESREASVEAVGAVGTVGTVAATGVFAVLLVTAGAWWAWDGTVGWGPRLLVPAVPLLAAVAAAGAARTGNVALALLVACGAGVNALGVFLPESAATAYVASMSPAVVPPRDAPRFPPHVLQRAPDGVVRVPRNLVASTDPAISPLRVHAHLLGCRLGGASPREVDACLLAPPWLSARPELGPALEPLPAMLRRPFAWPFLGSALGAGDRSSYRTAWLDAAVAQVFRKVESGSRSEAERALPLSARLFAASPSGLSAVARADALRAAGRRDELARFLADLSRTAPRLAATPGLVAVRALLARDEGDDGTARALLASLDERAPRPRFKELLAAPPRTWPPSVRLLGAGEGRGREPAPAPAPGR